MKRICEKCGDYGDFVWSRSKRDGHGRRLEVYACQNCGHEIELALA